MTRRAAFALATVRPDEEAVMAVAADRERCVGRGMCTSIGPDVFEMDDDSQP